MKFKLTYKVLRKSSIEPGYTFRGVKIYQETPNSHFCFDCEIDGVTYFVRVPSFYSGNMKDGQVLNVAFLGYVGKRNYQFGFLSDKDEMDAVTMSDSSELVELGVLRGQVFKECNVYTNEVKDINDKVVSVSYVEFVYQAKTLRYMISNQRIYPLKNLQNVAMVFGGYNKCGNPIFEFEPVHMEGSVKRISTHFVVITDSNGQKFNRVYTKACKLFHGLMDANTNIDLPLNVNPCHVSLNKTELKKRCAYYLSEEGESFCCQIIGKTDKVYYVLCHDTLGYIERTQVCNNDLKVGYSCICKLLEFNEKAYILPFEFEKYV